MTGATAGGVDGLVRAERVRALVDRNRVAQATVLLNSALVVLVLWGDAPPARLAVWLGAVWAVAAGRLGLGAAFRRAAPGPGAVGRWEPWLVAGAGANGVLWGLAPLVAGGGAPLVHLVFVAFVLAGMTAGAALSGASRQAAFLAFAVPALLPATVLLLRGGDRLRVTMGVLLAVFGAAAAALSRAGGRLLGQAVRLRFANAELAGGLAALNAALEARVAERTAELEAARARERDAERQLASAARLAMVGTLAAGVAHEINSPLACAKSSLQQAAADWERLAARAPEALALSEALAGAREGVDRVQLVVRRLMALAWVEPPREARPVDLHAALDLCLDLVRPELAPRARLARAYGDDVPPVLADRTALVQVFLNLLVNAAQAVPEGDPARHEVRVTTALAPGGGRVTVEVSDTGCGIAAAHLDRIWDPFFTTRPLPQGLGLGLTICRRLVRELGGTIAVRSREGAGSTFVVSLRTAPDEAAR